MGTGMGTADRFSASRTQDTESGVLKMINELISLERGLERTKQEVI